MDKLIDLLEIMYDRYGHHSTLVSSQLPSCEWHASIGDATLAEAILDRLMHKPNQAQSVSQIFSARHAGGGRSCLLATY